MNLDQKYTLITRNLKEIIGTEEEIKEILKNRSLKIYLGITPSGRIHIGYFVQILKIADYLTSDCEVTILIADLHAYLDNMKSSMESVKVRSKYYISMIHAMLQTLNVSIQKLKFVIASDYQLSNEYVLDIFKANSFITVKEAQHAGSEVVKQSQHPTLNSLLYPTLQALDEKYLNIDVETGGIDQRKIFGHARKIMPKIGYKPSFYFMTPIVSGLRFVKNETNTNPITLLDRKKLLAAIEIEVNDERLLHIINEINEDYQFSKLINSTTSTKMNSSDPNTKIDCLDSKNQIKSKINKAYCYPGDTDDNCLMDILKKIIFPLLQYKKCDFIIDRPEKFGGCVIYKSFEMVENDFQFKKLHPTDLKRGTIDMIDFILEPIRKEFETEELKNLLNDAYTN